MCSLVQSTAFSTTCPMRDVRLCLAGFIADFMLIIRPESGRRVILGRNKRSNSVYAKKERQTEPSAMRHLCHAHVVSPFLFGYTYERTVGLYPLRSALLFCPRKFTALFCGLLSLSAAHKRCPQFP